MKKILLLTSIAIALCSTSAFADVKQQSGVYGTLSGGWMSATTPSSSAATDNTVSLSNVNYTYGFNLGGQYAFTDHWAGGLEADVLTLGKINYKKNTTSTTTSHFPNIGIQVMAVGSYMMNNGFNAFLKGGAIATVNNINTNYTNTNDLSPSTIVKNQIRYLPAAAVGVGYMPLQNLNIAVQYERAFDSQWHANLATLNLTYTLPL